MQSSVNYREIPIMADAKTCGLSGNFLIIIMQLPKVIVISRLLQAKWHWYYY